jgi:hypothetical protein
VVHRDIKVNIDFIIALKSITHYKWT